jgi:hypothetical protein
MAGISVEFVGQLIYMARVESSLEMMLKLRTEMHA